jgi:hypothetical protein
MTDRLKTLLWRTILALIAMIIGWTLAWGPGEQARAGPGVAEHVNHENECVTGCETGKHICCVDGESRAWSP